MTAETAPYVTSHHGHSIWELSMLRLELWANDNLGTAKGYTTLDKFTFGRR